MLPILYEDRDVIVVLKPAGMLSQSADDDLSSSRLSTNACDEVKSYLGNVPGMINRLDCPVGGLMLFGKSSEATARLSAAMRDGRITKEYLAVVSGTFAPGERLGRMKDYLVRDKARSLTSVTAESTRGAKLALLDYSVISEYETDYGMSSLVGIRLITGRTHQIRAQFSSRKHPLIGDKRYGARDGGVGRGIALYSYKITFPTSGGVKTVISLPKCEYPYRADDLSLLSGGENA